MENEDIYNAAKEYTEECNSCTPFATSNAFCAGVEWMKAQTQSEIDELIEALEEATRWIPVSERLPEVGSEFLSLTKEPQLWTGRDNFSTTHALYKRTFANDNKCMQNLTDDGVTHWRLIDTPKADRLLEKYGKK